MNIRGNTGREHSRRAERLSRRVARGAVALVLFGACGLAPSVLAQPLPPPPTEPGAESRLSQSVSIQVREFEFEGNRKISSDRLRAVAEQKLTEYGTRTITSEQLEEIRKAITAEYTGTEQNPKYVNSGAMLEDQDVTSGVIKFTIIEGSLTEIRVMPVQAAEGKEKRIWLRRSYVTDRAARGIETPLDFNELQERLELLRLDPNISRLNAELRPGDQPGQSVLDLMIKEADRYSASVSFNNQRSPSVGAEQVVSFFSVRDLSGYGDFLAVRYGILQGGFDDMRLSGADDFAIDYSIPVLPNDATIGFNIQRNSDFVVEDPFSDLEIDSDSFAIGLSFRYPIIRTPRTEFSLFGSIEYRENQTRVLGDDFSFAPGADEGESRVTPLRFGQEFTYSAEKWAFSARSTFTLGTDWFIGGMERFRNDAGEPQPTPDAQFFAWLGQVQYVQQVISTRDIRMVLRGAVQLSGDNLLSIEQFSLGGVNTVRGYRENRLVRDNGVFASAELRVPVYRKPSRIILELVPFVDVGHAYNNNDDQEEFENSDTISSAGIGLIFQPVEWFTSELYYGYAFNKFENRDDLQDIGIHFNLTVSKKW